MLPSPRARQYQTHRQLLARTRARLGEGSLDAIIVPASRPAANLDHAVTLARSLDCWLVVLCSLNARAEEVNDLLALRNFPQAIVVDIDDGYTHSKLDFDTSEQGALDLAWEYISPNGDLSTKRNLGLLLARMVGWERIFFIDDDIRDLEASHLREAASMLGPYRTVGMRAVDFPDNSVVCHGHRETGEYQDVFISGSLLAVHSAEPVAFFPEIYNEDWFFFYHDAVERRLGWPGRDATQLCYDPFSDPQRAAVQEFGDVMAEGLYSLLHHRIGAARATSDYWKIFLDSRMSFLEAVLARTGNVADQYLQKRIASSVDAAMTCSKEINPSLCEQYVSLWKQDLGAWEQTLKDLPRQLPVKAALRELDLKPSDQNPYVLAGIIPRNRNDIRNDITAGAAALIPSSLKQSAAEVIRSFGAAEGPAVATSSGGRVSLTGTTAPEVQAGDRFGRVALDRMGRIALECVLRAILALAKEPSKPKIQSREGSRLAVGRHRKPSEPPEPGATPISTDTEDAGAGLGVNFAGVSLANGAAYCR
jgi:hypothetical protein